jgi:hypothetical protein
MPADMPEATIWCDAAVASHDVGEHGRDDLATLSGGEENDHDGARHVAANP